MEQWDRLSLRAPCIRSAAKAMKRVILQQSSRECRVDTSLLPELDDPDSDGVVWSNPTQVRVSSLFDTRFAVSM
jgi:hypothetical protein